MIPHMPLRTSLVQEFDQTDEAMTAASVGSLVTMRGQAKIRARCIAVCRGRRAEEDFIRGQERLPQFQCLPEAWDRRCTIQSCCSTER